MIVRVRDVNVSRERNKDNGVNAGASLRHCPKVLGLIYDISTKCDAFQNFVLHSMFILLKVIRIIIYQTCIGLAEIDPKRKE